MSTTHEKEPDELTLLLPWYLNGTLEPEMMARIDKALKTDPVLQHQFDLLLEDQAATLELAESETLPVAMGDRFRVALDQEIERARITSTSAAGKGQSWTLSRLIEAVFPTRSFAYAAAAAMLVIAVQSGIILQMSADQTPSQSGTQYETATGDSSSNGTVAEYLVMFQPGADFGDVSAFLSENNATIASGPSGDGFLTIRFESQSLENGTADVLSEKVESVLNERTDLISLYLPSGN